MRISDWSSDVCSSDLDRSQLGAGAHHRAHRRRACPGKSAWYQIRSQGGSHPSPAVRGTRSEEHTSELQSLIRISYAVFCLKKKNTNRTATPHKLSIYRPLELRHSIYLH